MFLAMISALEFPRPIFAHRSMPSIPIVDIGPLFDANSNADSAAVRSVQHDVVAALQEYGFVGVKGHGLPAQLVNQMRELTIALFALPIEQKLLVQVSPTNYRGYIPLEFFTPNAAQGKADCYEGYKLHFETQPNDPVVAECDLYGPNIWPDLLPELQSVVAQYWQACDRIALAMFEVLSLHLGVHFTELASAFEKPLTNMTLLHYPKAAASTEANAEGGTQYGIHPHKDTDALTILAPDKVGGLFLRPKGSTQWIEATVPDGCLVINVGDMLETWSNGEFVSTPHMVINKSGKERYSFPYFAVPRHNVEIKPLVQVEQRAKPPMMPSLGTAGEISRKIWYSNWPDAEAIEATLNPYSY